MRRLLTFLLVLFAIGYSKPQSLKILQIVPFGEGNIKITFNRDVSPNDLKQNKISNQKGLVDIKAILTTKRKNYTFSNKTSIKVAQQNKTTTRVLMQTSKKLNYRLRFVGKFLYIELKFSSSSKTVQKNKKIHNEKTTAVLNKKPKHVVIDAGHGGKDCGAIGVLKICEKAVTLGIAKFLEAELKRRGYTVDMTRTKDVYIGLRERTKSANDRNADLFVSIHANSIPKTSKSNANGVETYFLSTAKSERARRVAEKENKDSIEVMNFFSKQTFLNSMNTHRLVASNKLAIDIQGGILNALRPQYLGVLDGGVREGPFWVLAGALMPSVLVEVGYISHPQEGRRITNKEYQKLLAKGIADGIGGYFAKNP